MSISTQPPATQDAGREDAVQAAGTAVESPTDLDIYALLGVTQDVTPALAREIYWLKVERSREDHQRGAAEADRAVEGLNQALGVLLDDRERARYDRQYRPESPHTAPAASGRRRLRAGGVLALILLTVAGSVYAALEAGPVLLSAVVTSGMLAAITVIAWPRKQQDQPFALLQLTPDAGVREVNLAYEVIAQELLGRLKSDHTVINRLERLDRAHDAALRLIALRDGTGADSRPSLVGRLVRFVGRLLLAAFRFVLGVLGSLALGVLLWLMQAGGRTMVAVAHRLRLDVDRFSRFAHRQVEREPEDDLLEFSIDVSRRLAIGPQAAEGTEARAGTAVLERPAAVEAAPRPEVLLDAMLVLETANGIRRVPIPAAPLSIGSGPNCDLVLPADLGLAHEHAHVWQRDGSLLIHVLARRPGACLVNDRAMTWASLEDGDVILLGDARFSVQVL